MKIEMAKRLAVLAVVLVTGCASYYKVTDPASGRVYYTEEIDRQKGGTTIMFKDAKSGATVTLPSSEVLEVSSGEYKKGVGN